jgi:putative hemolysin
MRFDILMCPPLLSLANPEGCTVAGSLTIPPVHDLPANNQEGPAEPAEPASPHCVRAGGDLSPEAEADALRAECLPPVEGECARGQGRAVQE